MNLGFVSLVALSKTCKNQKDKKLISTQRNEPNIRLRRLINERNHQHRHQSHLQENIVTRHLQSMDAAEMTDEP